MLATRENTDVGGKKEGKSHQCREIKGKCDSGEKNSLSETIKVEGASSLREKVGMGTSLIYLRKAWV